MEKLRSTWCGIQRREQLSTYKPEDLQNNDIPSRECLVSPLHRPGVIFALTSIDTQAGGPVRVEGEGVGW